MDSELTIEDMLLYIATRNGISVSEVLVLVRRQVDPLIWMIPAAIESAYNDAPAWQVWRKHFHELLEMGYYKDTGWR